jgi:uncharacterized protein (TIGR03435 family)
VKVSILLFLFAPISSAQTQPAVDFDAASVKIDRSGSGHTGIDRDGGLLRMTGVTLRVCLARAYQVTAPQISGPDWIDTEKYDIVAKIAFDDKEGQMNVRLQRLLADRFKLTLHRETKESPVLALIVDKKGPKISEDEPAGTDDDGMTSKRGHLDAKRVTMARLADFLASPRTGLAMPVVNGTGMTGIYSFSLDWTPENSDGSAKETGDAPPPIFAALQEQLGLKLVARRAPVELLVIDHAERVPTEN